MHVGSELKRIIGLLTYQCGQRNVASAVVRGAIIAAVMFGVVRSWRTGDGEETALGFETGAEVGWLMGSCWESGDVSSEGCVEGLVAPRAGEPGCEAAREL